MTQIDQHPHTTMTTTTLANYKWIELAALFHAHQGAGMCRHKYAILNDASSIAVWRARFDNTDLYTSVCRFKEPDHRDPGVCPLFLDIDGKEGREQARGQTLTVIERLQLRLGVDPTAIDVFFSGHKGFHIEVQLEVFGGPADPKLMQVWRHLALRLKKEGLDCVDTQIYQNNRLWRMVNSIHGSSDLYKVPLEAKELQDLGLDYVLEVAQHPREFESMAERRESPKATGWLSDALAWLDRKRSRQRPSASQAPASWNLQGQGWRRPPCVRYVEQRAVLEDGQRHAIYLALARFYASIGMHPEEMIDQLRLIDTRNPIRDPDYIERLARQQWKHPGLVHCPNEALEPYCEKGGCPSMGIR
jgi:hypothetical protein